MKASTGDRCIGEPAVAVRAFEVELTTFFAADPSCHGIVLVTNIFDVSGSAPKPEWRLELMVDLGDSQPSWELVHLADKVYMTGKGGPEQIAHSICSIAKGIGGSVR